MAQKRSTKRNKAGNRRKTPHHMVEDVLSLVRTLLSSRKDWVADKVSNLSNATHTFADALKDIPGVGTYASLTAESLDDFAEYMSEVDFNDLVRDGSVFAKRHPLQTLAGAVVVGIIATQIYRSGPKAQ